MIDERQIVTYHQYHTPPFVDAGILRVHRLDSSVLRSNHRVYVMPPIADQSRDPDGLVNGKSEKPSGNT